MEKNSEDISTEAVQPDRLSKMDGINKNFRRLSLLKNKYLLAGTFFLIWMLFFDPKDISSEINRWEKFHDLKASELQLTKKITDTRSELNELKNNARTIEKYAREKYLMKKDNEDLFVIPAAKTIKE